jgi:rod shape-determining protein MreD
MAAVRAALFLVLLLAAVVLQTAFFPYFSFQGVTPNVVLLVVVAAGLVRGPEFAAVLGFSGGLLLDLVPPADHVAGRWALALMVVGFLAGRVRPGAGRSAAGALATVAAASFVGTSVFALSGMAMVDTSVTAGEALRVIPLSVLFDLLLAPFVLAVAMRVFRRVQAPQVAY